MISITLNIDCTPGRNIFLPDCSIDEIRYHLEKHFLVPQGSYYITHEGILITNGNTIIENGHVNVFPRLLGGKGGFGSMLRAIGAQIEKTTNREACRDLSGRRLRDINEEQRLKSWISQQAEREREQEERKKKKLEKLSSEPKHEFRDDQYETARSVLSEQLNDAVEQGFLVSQSNSKRPASGDSNLKNKKKKFFMLSDEELSSSDSSDNDEPKKTVKCDNDSVNKNNDPCLKVEIKQEVGDLNRSSSEDPDVSEPTSKEPPIPITVLAKSEFKSDDLRT